MKKFVKRQWTVLVLALVMTLTAGAQVFASSYKDIAGHWSEGTMIKAAELGWIKGYEDNTLRPNQAVTRAEYIAMVHRMAGLSKVPAKSASVYGDVNQAAWADETIRQAEAARLLEPVFPGPYLRPNDPITREEAATLLNVGTILRNMGAKSALDEEGIEGVQRLVELQINRNSRPEVLPYADRGAVTPRFVWAVDDLSRAKVISGYEDKSFKPQGKLTRAEAMTLILKATGETPAQVQKPAPQPQPTLQPQPAAQAKGKIVQEEGKYYIVDVETGVRFSRSSYKDGYVTIGDQAYLIGADDALTSGFIRRDNKTYYIDREKGKVRGWKKVGDGLYYFSPVNYRMYRNGMFSTGEGVYWFGKDGKLQIGKRPGGQHGRKVYWAGPSAKELENGWLTGPNQELRFRGQEIANYAAAFEGQPFRWYGFEFNSGKGVYCVGLTYATHKAFGIHIPGPNDADIHKHKGYELPRVQYEAAYKFGGMRYPANFANAWPGDIIFNYSPNFYLGYNHVGLYMGKNNGRDIYVHATLKNGIFVGDCREMNRTIGRRFNKEFVRYNTDKNKGNGKIPEILRRQ
ncbi:MAG: S-layer homology domain-containing protein [Aedoeadaptatus pacaensis]